MRTGHTQKNKIWLVLHHIKNVAIQEFNGANYLTLTKHSTINEAEELNIDRQDDIPDKTLDLKVQFTPDGINMSNHIQATTSAT